MRLNNIEMNLVFIIAFLPSLVWLLLSIAYYNKSKKRFNMITQWMEKVKNVYEKAHLTDSSNKSTMFEARLESVIFAHFFTILLFYILTLSAIVNLTNINLYIYNIEINKILFFINNLNIVNFIAILGAYIWGLLEYISHFKNLDWTPSKQHLIWIRVIIVIFISTFFIGSANEITTYIIAFGLGTIPTEVFYFWLKEKTSEKLGIKYQEIITKPNWELIDGITPNIINKLTIVNIENPSQLANSDPFIVHSRTNIQWKILLDLIDQSFLYIYFKNNIIELQKLGIRGAIDLVVIYERFQNFNSNNIDKLPNYEQTLINLSKLLKIEYNLFLNIIKNMQEDTQLTFIWELWNLSINNCNCNKNN